MAKLRDMPFREKSAWISLVTMVVVFGSLFGALLTGRLAPHGPGTVHVMLLSVAAAVLMQAALHLAAWLMARADAATPKDERERLIGLKATRIAYVVLVLGVLGGVFAVLHTPLFGGPSGSKLALVVMAAVILADVAKSAATVVQYRRDA